MMTSIPDTLEQTLGCGHKFRFRTHVMLGSTPQWPTSSDAAASKVVINKSNTGEGDNPDTAERATKYELPEINSELSMYVRVGMDKKAEIELSECGAREDEERA